MISLPDLSDLFVEVADTLVDDFDLITFLDRLTTRVAAVSGAAAVGLVLADHRGRLRLMASSIESGETLELLQLQNDEGPCLDCVASGVAVVNADLEGAVERWPLFAPRALEAGFRSVHAFPMRLRHEVIGVLNLFGTDQGEFEADEARVVQGLADVATIAILQERHLAQADLLTEQLQSALNTRIVVEQAKGALAQTEGITPAEAFDILRSRARSSGQRLVEIAEDVLNRLGPPGARKDPVE